MHPLLCEIISLSIIFIGTMRFVVQVNMYNINITPMTKLGSDCNVIPLICKVR